jgi:hypothetical protein
MAKELQAKIEWSKKNAAAGLKEPYHLFFFRSVDRDGIVRFFDIMDQEGDFSIAEAATSAPRLAQCANFYVGGQSSTNNDPISGHPCVILFRNIGADSTHFRRLRRVIPDQKLCEIIGLPALSRTDFSEERPSGLG